jgi:hypothetical protein
MHRTWTLALVTPVALFLASLPGPSAAATQKSGWYEKAVKRVEAKFDPAEAKPGQTVTFKLTVDLNDGYYTYPVVQPNKSAADYVNRLKFPVPGDVIFVGATTDPKRFETKDEPELMIKDLHYLPGTSTFTRKAVVSPKAAAGTIEVKLASFELSVCDKSNCFPGKKVPVSAKLKVLDGPPVEVEKEFAEEVAKALKTK